MEKNTKYDYLKDAITEVAYEHEPLANAILWTLNEIIPGFQQMALENFNKSMNSNLDRLTSAKIEDDGLDPKDLY